MELSRNNIILGAGGLVFLIVIGVTGFLFTQGTFADISGERKMSYMTNVDQNCYYRGIGQGFTIDGDQVKMQNLFNSPNSGQPIVELTTGDNTRSLQESDFPVRWNGFKISLSEVETKRVWEIGGNCGGGSKSYNEVQNVIYNVETDVPKTQVTFDVKDLKIEDVSPGVKKVDATIVADNKWYPIEADRYSVKMLGEKVDFHTGTIPQGETEYQVTFKKSFYDASKFLVNKNVQTQIQVHAENPRVPQDLVSGKPDMNGNFFTYESFSSGGNKPNIDRNSDYDGKDFIELSGTCDIKYLRTHGGSASWCETNTGGGTIREQHTSNWDFRLENFKSVSYPVNVSVSYCGENATFQDGECVIDSELHLRGDLCPLLENHQLVTETFPAGETIQASSLEPEPSFFCTKHPVLVTDGSGEQTEFTTDPYRKLVEGEPVTVPDGQTYTMYWTVNTDEVDVSTVCKEGSFNKSTGKCERTPGVTHKCSQGVYDPATGSCVVEPEVQNVCDVGRYNSELGKCQYEPDANNKCSIGYFDNVTSSCLAPSNVKMECPESAVQDNGECVVEPSVVKQTPLQDLRLAFSRVYSKYTEVVVGVAVLLGLGVIGLVLRSVRKRIGGSSSRSNSRRKLSLRRR